MKRSLFSVRFSIDDLAPVLGLDPALARGLFEWTVERFGHEHDSGGAVSSIPVERKYFSLAAGHDTGAQIFIGMGLFGSALAGSFIASGYSVPAMAAAAVLCFPGAFGAAPIAKRTALSWREGREKGLGKLKAFAKACSTMARAIRNDAIPNPGLPILFVSKIGEDIAGRLWKAGKLVGQGSLPERAGAKTHAWAVRRTEAAKRFWTTQDEQRFERSLWLFTGCGLSQVAEDLYASLAKGLACNEFAEISNIASWRPCETLDGSMGFVGNRRGDGKGLVEIGMLEHQVLGAFTLLSSSSKYEALTPEGFERALAAMGKTRVDPWFKPRSGLPSLAALARAVESSLSKWYVLEKATHDRICALSAREEAWVLGAEVGEPAQSVGLARGAQRKARL